MTPASDHDAATVNPTQCSETDPPVAHKWRSWLAPALVLMAGLIIYLPAVRARFFLDDYLHASILRGTFPVSRSPLDLYTFIGEGERATLLERGMLPWWSDPQLKIRFFRPLSSALIWADHRLLGDDPLPLHLHSLLWWGATVLAARWIFQRVLTARPALYATVIFALAPCHALPLAWLANREAFISLTFGLLALAAMLRFHDQGEWREVGYALGFSSLSLLGGEYAFSVGGYILTLAIAARGVALQRRLSALLSFAGPALVYLGVRAHLGYGTAGSGFYTDPFGAPLTFLRHAPRRAVTLLANGWLSLDGEALDQKTPAWMLAAIFVTGVAVLGLGVRRVFASLDAPRRMHARWLLAGSFLALVPVLAVQPSPRLVGASMVGIAATVALVLDQAWHRAAHGSATTRGAEFVGLFAVGLGFFHLVHGPVTSWLSGRNYQRSSARFEASARAFAAGLANPSEAEVMVMRTSGSAFFMPFALQPNFEPPKRWRILAQTGHVLALRRGPRALELVVPEDQALFPEGLGNLYRSEETTLGLSGTVSVPGMRVKVLKRGPQGPRVVRFETDVDLDEQAWGAERKRDFTQVTPPAPGFGKPFPP
ncbi:hypothetical protein [Chondromyces crocatus]|uniref:Glycosyltransferase RgtA/B/C/D-like domain-containing protein n=1 Tax=Chondromyces crocatus TaxID=52 RepID=A0A0K1EDF6_CHOCO|nr:hypothetical protein [Chondromyces crocatus]AKT38911.1 uncharacterized protein CMC5_030580 [Chondromyces crocatus]